MKTPERLHYGQFGAIHWRRSALMMSTPNIAKEAGERLIRAIEILAYRLRALLWLRKANLGGKVQARGRVWVKSQGRIDIGYKAAFESGPGITELSVHKGGHLIIGERTMFNYGCIIEVVGRMEIGRRCMIGHQVLLIDCDMHGLEVAKRQLKPAPRPIVIEDDVWICSRAVILPGVRIGQGSVVSAGSVVIRDIPPNSLVCGNPARVVKSIFQQ